jgi:flagellar basal body-associated protein FliL
MTIIYRSLLILVLFLVVIFLAGTVYAFFFRASEAKASGTGAYQASLPDSANPSAEPHIFTGIGRQRLSTADQNGADLPDAPVTVIISVTFPYTPEDRAFSEELAARIRDFRAITEAYFGSIKAEHLRNMSEELIKSDLLERYNGVLRLGKIGTLYFSDFMLLE